MESRKKVIIADDESLICSLLERIIQWDELHLQLAVTASTTVGELLNDLRTAETTQRLFGEFGIERDNCDEMMQIMFTGSPLRSLVSFGMLESEQMRQIIDTLNDLLF